MAFLQSPNFRCDNYPDRGGDKEVHKLFLARDRFGEKPLYYGLQKGLFAFGSELKALQPLKKAMWQFDVNRQALASFLANKSVPAPLSIFQGVSKISPGTFLVVDAQGDVCEKTYWSAEKAAISGYASPVSLSFADAVKQLDQRLRGSLALQKSSDVPIGAFLSGGIDSSVTVAIMQQVCSSPVKTFSIGFFEEKYNEAPFAKAVAEHLRTDHTEVYLSQEQAMEIVPSLPEVYDEPFGDSSQIPTLLVSQIAKEKVTVCISGDGGDEIFGGYGRYFRSKEIWDKFSRIPVLLRPFASLYTR